MRASCAWRRRMKPTVWSSDQFQASSAGAAASSTWVRERDHPSYAASSSAYDSGRGGSTSSGCVGRAATTSAHQRWTVARCQSRSAALTDALATADPAATAWTWAPEQTVGFILRRQAHEALIHRLDAEQVVGEVTPLDPRLATDGIDEAIRIMFGGTPDWAEFRWEAGPVAVIARDTGARWSAQVGRVVGRPEGGEAVDEPSLEVYDGRTADPVAQVSGTAGALDSWLWGRVGDDAVTREGDPQAQSAFGRVIGNGID